MCGHIKLEDIQQQLQQFWQIEEVVPSSGEPLPNTIEQDYISTTRFTDEGRVMVRLPYSQNGDTLGQ